MKINVYHSEPKVFQVIKSAIEGTMKVEGINLIESSTRLLHTDGTFVMKVIIGIGGYQDPDTEYEMYDIWNAEIQEAVKKIQEYLCNGPGIKEKVLENYSGGGYIWEGPGTLVTLVNTDNYCIIDATVYEQ